MSTETMILSAGNIATLDGLVKVGKSFGNTSDAIRADLDTICKGLEGDAAAAKVDAYNAASRAHLKSKVTDTVAQARVLALFAKVVSLYRKDKGLAGKRAAGAGRPKADTLDKPEEKPALVTVEDVLLAIAAVIKAAPNESRKAIRERLINAVKTA